MLDIKVQNAKNNNTIFNTKDWIEYTDEVKKALEKQIPKELILENRTHICPNCKEIYFYMKYCGSCGQRLIGVDI